MALGPESQLSSVAHWLLCDGWRIPETDILVESVVERLLLAGIPLQRLGVFLLVLHPEVLGVSYIWQGAGSPVVHQQIPRGFEHTDDFRLSPLTGIFAGTSAEVHQRIDAIAEDHPYPIYRAMRRQGISDYLCLPLEFSDSRHAISFSTVDPRGFSSEQVREMRDTVLVLQRILEAHNMRRIADVLLSTYVGTQAGPRILHGQITRGSSESIRAVIWLSDLRGFTPLSDQLPRDQLIERLNTYFDCVVPPIQRSGGEVLKFMGDAVLGMWRIDAGDDADVTERALGAATEISGRIALVNAQASGEGQPHLRFGAALHVGEVMYGNIGAYNRLDFTVIGPAVNLASRIEKLSKRVGHSILASADFAARCGVPLASLGSHALDGIAEAQEVFRVEVSGPGV